MTNTLDNLQRIEYRAVLIDGHSKRVLAIATAAGLLLPRVSIPFPTHELLNRLPKPLLFGTTFARSNSALYPIANSSAVVQSLKSSICSKRCADHCRS